MRSLICDYRVKRDSLFEERLGLVFMVIVNQLQIHVDKERVEDLGQLCSVTVQNGFYEPLQAAVVNLIESWVALLTVGRQNHVDVWLILTGCY